MINNITLIGRLGRDSEVLAPQGLTRLSVATTHSWKDKASGEWKENTDWHRVTIWREMHIPKGGLVYVEGRVSYREHEGKWYTEIIAHSVRHLDRQKDSTHMPPTPVDAVTAEVPERITNPITSSENRGSIDDIPF